MKNLNSNKVRYWEIDFIRGVAIIGMVLYHILIDLAMFKLRHYPSYPEIYGINLASVFIVISGVSLSITFIFSKSYERFLSKALLRGIRIFSLGIVVNILTFIFFPDSYVRFGILHLLGLSIILGSLLIKFRYINLLLSLLIIILGYKLKTFTLSNEGLIWLGIRTNNFNSLDYFPMLPWFGFFTLGMVLGTFLYSKNGRKFKMPDFSNTYIVKFFAYAGRKSLLIYLLHQPVIFVLLILTGLLSLKQIFG